MRQSDRRGVAVDRLVLADTLNSPPPPSHAAVAQLYAELSELNLNLPARVCVPLYGSCHQVLRVPTSEAVVLNSKSKVGKEGDESVSVEVGRRWMRV